jgi:hypothetical protein
MAEDIAAFAEMTRSGQAGTGQWFAKHAVLPIFVFICKLFRELFIPVHLRILGTQPIEGSLNF